MKNKKEKLEKRKLRAIGSSEIFILIIAIFAFTFLISEVKTVEASSIIQSGCCAEGVDGSICQEMNLVDEAMCKNSLLATGCDYLEECQKGCCYNTQEGLCSLNSPKGKCEENGGNWSKSPNCEIPQCQLGCCVLGNQASITTSRECTQLSKQLNFEKKFEALDGDGSCNSKVDLEKEGACLIPTDDFSGENNIGL